MEDSRPRKRNQIAVACNECRKRKIKCDGSRPRCKPCSGRGSHCNYDADPDATPIIALKRKYEQLQQMSQENEQLLHMLKTRPEDEAQAIFKHLRTNSDAALTLDLVKDSDVLLPSQPPPPYRAHRVSLPSFEEFTGYEGQASQASPTRSVTSPSITSLEDRPSSVAGAGATGPGQQYTYPWRGATRPDLQRPIESRANSGPPARFFHSNSSLSINREDSNGTSSTGSLGSPIEQRPFAARVAKKDPRLSHVKAADWGVDYIGDDDFAIILSSYFTWDHPYSKLFDEDLFIEGLSKPRSSEFCSALLVNAIIAVSAKTCTSVDPLVSLTATHAASTETARLWDLEYTHDHLASIPAGLLLQASTGSHGKGKVALTYVLQAIRIAQTLGLFRLSTANSVYDSALPITSKGRAVIAWALYEQQMSIFENVRQEYQQSLPPPVPHPYRASANAR